MNTYTPTADPMAYSVDRTDVNRRISDANGDVRASAHTRWHRHVDGDCLAVCSSRILTNWPDGAPGADPRTLPMSELCAKCFPPARAAQWMRAAANRQFAEIEGQLARRKAEHTVRVIDAIDREIADTGTKTRTTPEVHR